MKKINNLTFIIILILFVCCSKGKWEGKNYIKNGTENVENFGSGLWGERIHDKLYFKKELTIGRESGNNSQIFYENIEIYIDEDLNVFVLDIGNHRLLKFNSYGEFIWTSGRRGQGPGEFQRPSRVFGDQAGKIYVLD